MAVTATQRTHEFPGLFQEDAPVWASAADEFVTDERGTQYLDMVMGFGAAIWGHSVVLDKVLGAYDAKQLVQGLPGHQTHVLREQATKTLCEFAAKHWVRKVAGDRWEADDLRATVAHSGSEAVEIALKTAILATGRSEVVSFDPAYHGQFGIAAIGTVSDEYPKHFGHLVDFTHARHEPWGEIPKLSEKTACVLFQPTMKYTGENTSGDDYAHALRAACDEAGALFIVDNVLAGCGRTGVELDSAGAAPDIICLGKAVGGGVPASAVIAPAELAERAWNNTSFSQTFLSHSLSCAGIIESLGILQAADLRTLSGRLETALRQLEDDGLTLRGRGAIWTIDSGGRKSGREMVKALLDDHVFVQSGKSSISILASLKMRDESLERFVGAVRRAAA